jgi:hypothetical protein
VKEKFVQSAVTKLAGKWQLLRIEEGVVRLLRKLLLRVGLRGMLL